MKKLKRLNSKLFEDAIINEHQLLATKSGCELVAKIYLGGTYSSATGEIRDDYEAIWDCEGWPEGPEDW